MTLTVLSRLTQAREAMAVTGALLVLVVSGCIGSGARPASEAADQPVAAPLPIHADPRIVLVSRHVSFDVEGVELQQVIRQLAVAGDLEVVNEQKIEKSRYETPVTLRVSNVTLGSALSLVLEPGGLAYCFDGNGVLITEPARLAPEQRAELFPFRSRLEQSWRPVLERRVLAQRTSCDIKDVPVSDFLDFLARRYDVNFVLVSVPYPPPNLTIKLTDVTLVQLFDAVGRELKADWTLRDEAVCFTQRR